MKKQDARAGFLRRRLWRIGLAAVWALSGCATTADLIAKNQNAAMQAALDRARFDTGCLQPKGTVLSTEVVVPPVGQGAWVAGGRKAKYAVRVSGCGKTNTFTVICPETGDSCSAADVGQPVSP